MLAKAIFCGNMQPLRPRLGKPGCGPGKRHPRWKIDDMSKVPHRLVVVGHGAAGLTAAVAAAEAARARRLAVEITLLEKAAAEAAGGNTLWSPSYMRLDANDRIAPDFEDAMLECDRRPRRGSTSARSRRRHGDGRMAGAPWRRLLHADLLSQRGTAADSAGRRRPRPRRRAVARRKRLGVDDAIRVPCERIVSGGARPRRRGRRWSERGRGGNDSRRCRHPRGRRLSGRRRNDARAFRSGRGKLQADFARARATIPATASAWR